MKSEWKSFHPLRLNKFNAIDSEVIEHEYNLNMCKYDRRFIVFIDNDVSV